MSRLIAAALVIALCAIGGDSQPRQQKKSPLEVTTVDGEVVWKITGPGYVSMGEVLSHYSKFCGGNLVYNPADTTGEIHFMPPEGGAEHRGEQIDLLAASVVDQFRYVIMESSPGLLEIVPGVEAVTHAPVVTEQELAALNSARYTCCLVTLHYADPNSMTALLRNMVCRQSGTVQPMQDSGGILIGDRCDRVRQLVALARKIDEGAKAVIRYFAVPEAAVPADVVETLVALFANDYRMRNVRFATAPNRQGIIVRGPVGALDLVGDAIRTLE